MPRREATEVVRPARVVDPDRGRTVSPALVVSPDPSAALVGDEQFAPALPILPYADFERAIDAANDTNFGLCASVWMAIAELAEAAARRLDAGTVWTNAHGMGAMDHLAPMGGWGDSGLGTELGLEGMAAFTRPRVMRRGASESAGGAGPPPSCWTGECDTVRDWRRRPQAVVLLRECRVHGLVHRGARPPRRLIRPGRPRWTPPAMTDHGEPVVHRHGDALGGRLPDGVEHGDVPHPVDEGAAAGPSGSGRPRCGTGTPRPAG